VNKVLYYHVYLNDNPVVWVDNVIEQVSLIQDYGLLDYLDVIKVTAITQDDPRTVVFRNLCSSYSNKFEIDFVQNPFSNDMEMLSGLNHAAAITENYTFQKLYNDCSKEDQIVGYIHTKGATAPSLHLTRGDVSTYKKYVYWRHYLNWGVLEKWKECINSLDEYDVAGVNLCETPSLHYSGNFWWSKSNHIKSLPDPAQKDWWNDLKNRTTDPWLKTADDRFRDEQWVCVRDETKAYSISSGFNPSVETLPRYMYEETK
jgi:hypothetical protein